MPRGGMIYIVPRLHRDDIIREPKMNGSMIVAYAIESIFQGLSLKLTFALSAAY